MTDQPPPTDKKPRRRSAPRKRAVAKQASPTDAVATASDTHRVNRESSEGATEAPAAASTVDTVAKRLDPKPLVDAGDRGDAPATDSPLARTPAAEASEGRAPRSRRRKGERPKAVEQATDATPERRQPASLAPAPAPAPSAGPELRSADAPGSTGTSTAPTPTPAPAPAPFPKQAELRPGELIRVPLSVRWRDLDAFNHVNNSKYLSYLEEARLRWMLAMPGMGMDEDVAPVVAASNLNYRRPIAWPGDVVVELFVERIGGSSLTIGHRIVDSKDGGTVYCDGNVVMVWIDRNSGRSAPLPDSVRAACR